METTLAYLAGLLDGEGCIGLYRHPESMVRGQNGKLYRSSRGHDLVVQIQMTHPAGLDLFAETFGGNVRRQPRLLKGRPYIIYRWSRHSAEALRVLTALFPYLRLKRDEAYVAMRFQQTKRTYSRTRKATEQELEQADLVYGELRRLKRTEIP